jgi:hypothetical protein
MADPFDIVPPLMGDAKPAVTNSQVKGLLWPLLIIGVVLFGIYMWGGRHGRD